ncbi:MAG TPA: hypothetical protein VJ579_02225 [Candidatus Paceibacterota bacterium]|nr:hypothetical protein [Candidatus Paceibacterota bacterium]
MVTSVSPEIKKEEKPALSTIALRQDTIRLALTVRTAPKSLWSMPVTGGHSEPDPVPSGQKIVRRVTDVCVGTDILRTHRLLFVDRKDVSYNGKRRDKFIFVMVPAGELEGESLDSPFLPAAFVALSEHFVHEAFNEAIVYDNGESGLCIEFRGEAHRRNAHKSFVIA